MERICCGDGTCLEIAYVDGAEEYYKNPCAYCSYDCKPMECANILVCGRSVPEYVLFSNDGICCQCDLLFGEWRGGRGRLSKTDGAFTCPACSRSDMVGISQPNCDHYTCEECFRNAYYPMEIAGSADRDGEPQFPYSVEEEREYYANSDDPKWRNDPIIMQYNADWYNWDNQRRREPIEEDLQYCCPICKQ